MNARVGLYSLQGTFGGEWVRAAELLKGANVIHPFVLSEIRRKYMTIFWQGENDYQKILGQIGIQADEVDRAISDHLLLVINFELLHQSWQQALDSSTYQVG